MTATGVLQAIKSHPHRTEMKIPKKNKNRRGNTLLEVMTVVAAISMIGAVGFLTVRNAMTGAKDYDMKTKVAALNRAVGMYVLSGGSLADPLADVTDAGLYQDGMTLEEAVLIKLKSVASSEQSKEINGLRGSMLNETMKPDMHTTDDGDADSALVVWDPNAKKFVLDPDAASGIKGFSQETGTPSPQLKENRPPKLQLADRKSVV